MSKGSRTDLCGGWPERAIPTVTGRGLNPRLAGDLRCKVALSN